MKLGSQNQSCLLGSYIISYSTYWMKTSHKLFFFHKGIGVEPSIKSYKSAQNNLNEVLKTKTLLGS